MFILRPAKGALFPEKGSPSRGRGEPTGGGIIPGMKGNCFIPDSPAGDVSTSVPGQGHAAGETNERELLTPFVTMIGRLEPSLNLAAGLRFGRPRRSTCLVWYDGTSLYLLCAMLPWAGLSLSPLAKYVLRTLAKENAQRASQK